MLHVYYGEGKGKTTSAAGLAIRALGHGQKVFFLQFLKMGRAESLRCFGRPELRSSQEKPARNLCR